MSTCDNNTVAAAVAMLKLALAMISAAFRTTPFSMSMHLCPNATMSLHSPSIFDVVSSITDRVLHHQQQVGGGEGRGDDAAVASPLVALGHDAASPEHGHAVVAEDGGLAPELAEGADGVGLVGGARATDLAVRRGGGSATSSSWARVW
uniref:Uncharacterized protein n=1 Tax=Oryza meridionalis TaxID=40149 RepID=A0A0E0DE05_9ORYZ